MALLLNWKLNEEDELDNELVDELQVQQDEKYLPQDVYDLLKTSLLQQLNELMAKIKTKKPSLQVAIQLRRQALKTGLLLLFFHFRPPAYRYRLALRLLKDAKKRAPRTEDWEGDVNRYMLETMCKAIRDEGCDTTDLKTVFDLAWKPLCIQSGDMSLSVDRPYEISDMIGLKNSLNLVFRTVQTSQILADEQSKRMIKKQTL
jgi:hypothetical protein